MRYSALTIGMVWVGSVQADEVAAVDIWPKTIEQWQAPAKDEHPRLFLRQDQVAALRARLQPTSDDQQASGHPQDVASDADQTE